MKFAGLVMAGVIGGCVPAQPGRRPPPEAVEACATREIGAPCGFHGPRGPIHGHCFVPPGEQAPACVPGRPPREAIEACAGREPGSPCHFTGPRGPADGRCEAPPERPVACRPNHENSRV